MNTSVTKFAPGTIVSVQVKSSGILQNIKWLGIVVDPIRGEDATSVSIARLTKSGKPHKTDRSVYSFSACNIEPAKIEDGEWRKLAHVYMVKN